MRLVIFGATGKTGVPLVKQALEAGHEVVAFARTPSKLAVEHKNLSVVQGDAADPAAVSRAIEGADAVISALGHVKGSPGDIQTVATRHIVDAMKEHGVKRLVSLSGAGLPAPQDEPGIFDYVIRFALKVLSGEVLEDAVNHAEVLKQERENIEWVIVRGPMLTEEPANGDYRVGWVGVNTGTRASRENVADFMLKQVQDDTYLYQMPVISD